MPWQASAPFIPDAEDCSSVLSTVRNGKHLCVGIYSSINQIPTMETTKTKAPFTRGLGVVTPSVLFVLVLTSLSALTGSSRVMAQNHVISYQGSIDQNQAPLDKGGWGVNLTVTLYADPQGNTAIWQDNFTTQVNNGIFNISLGSGKPLPSPQTLDRQLWLGVAVNGTDELRPLTKLAAVPLALNVADEAISIKKLAPDVVKILTGVNQTPQALGETVTLAGNDYDLAPGVEWIGSKSSSGGSKQVWFKADGSTVLRLSHSTSGTPNIIGGHNDNSIDSSIKGSVITGGGQSGGGNHIYADYSFIGGGSGANTIQAGNGTGTTTALRSNAFEVSNNGHSTVFDENGNGTASNGTYVNGRPSFRGATYTDNIIYAWGDVERDINPDLIANPNGVLVRGSEGCQTIKRLAVGVYEIELNIQDPLNLGPQLVPSAASITANIVLPDVETPNPQCAFIFPSRIDGGNKFRLRLYYQANCAPVDLPFMFKVTGRP